MSAAIQKWNTLQKAFAKSKHSDLEDVDGNERMVKARNAWKRIKQLDESESEKEYQRIINKYHCTPTNTSPNKSPNKSTNKSTNTLPNKRTDTPTNKPTNIPPAIIRPKVKATRRRTFQTAFHSDDTITNVGLFAHLPPKKKHRHSSAHRVHATPRINDLKDDLAYWHHQLDDILDLRAKPNRNQKQIDNDIKKQTEIQQTIEEIKQKIKERVDNNKRVRECRQRQRNIKDYIISHKSDIIMNSEHDMNDVNMYKKPGRPRTE